MTLYLNNDGSRWVEVVNGKRDMPFILVLPDGTPKKRQADAIEAFGNFACICYRYQGKAYRGIPKSQSNSDVRLDHEPMISYVFHAASARINRR